jgi:hypothetical protein
MSSSTAAPKKKGKETPIRTGIARQKTVLSELPDDYQCPLFDGRQAIESQRKSGYKTTARAAREIIDNALEAGAENMWIVLKRPAESERSKGEPGMLFRRWCSSTTVLEWCTEDTAGRRCAMGTHRPGVLRAHVSMCRLADFG